MSNIYDPPASSLDDEPGMTAGFTKFYVVAPFKFAMLYLFTFGVYHIYWFYRNWSEFKVRTQERMWPAVRSIFNIFFAHALFREVESAIESEGYDYTWNPRVLATVYVTAQIAGYVMDRLPDSTDKIVMPLDFGVLLPLIGFLLYRAQRAINVACGDPTGASNARLTVANYAWIAFGALIMILALISFIIPTPVVQ